MGLREEVERQTLKTLQMERTLLGSLGVETALREQERMERLFGPRDAIQEARESLELSEAMRLREEMLERQHYAVLKGLDTVEDLRRLHEENRARELERLVNPLGLSPVALEAHNALEEQKERLRDAAQERIRELTTIPTVRMPDPSQFIQPPAQPRKERRPKPMPPQAVAAPAPEPRSWLHRFLERQYRRHGIVWKFLLAVAGLILAAWAVFA